MIPQQLKQMFGLNSQKDVNMANNIWKMLDQMAENSPDNYKQFIQKNIKEGVQQVKQKKDQKQKPFKIKPQKGFLLQFDVILNETYINLQTKSQTSPKITGMLEQKLDLNKDKWQDLKKKFKPKIHILLNVCFSDRVKLPLDKKKKQLRNLTLEKLKDIQIFYYSLQGPKQQAQGKQLDYMMIVSKNMYESLIKQHNQHGRKMLMSLAIAYFDQRLQSDRNPLLKLYNPQQYKKLAFYTVQKISLQTNSEKTYFYNNSTDVQQILLERQVDIKRQKEIKQQQQKIKTQIKQQTQKAQIKFIKQQKQESILSKVQSKNANKLSNQESNSKNHANKENAVQKKQKLKKPLIQVLNQTEITDSVPQQFPYELKQTDDGYHIEILIPGIKNLDELDLQINNSKVKLKSKESQRITEIQLKSLINTDSIKAKHKKKSNRLIIQATFLKPKSH